MHSKFTIILLLVCVAASFAELEPGVAVPNPELTSQNGDKVRLYDLFSDVTVLHLWKCN